MPAPAQTASDAAAMPTASAQAKSASRFQPAPTGRMKRCDSRLSMMFACTCIPGMMPSVNGTVNRSRRPAAVVPMTTILSRNTAGSTFGFSPARIWCSE